MLGKEDYSERTGKYKSNAWQLQVRYAKKKMEHNHLWLVKNLKRGECQLSEAGMKEWNKRRSKSWEPKFNNKQGGKKCRSTK